MPARDLISPLVVPSEGGLVLDTGVYAMQPGWAQKLDNYEPDVSGGYRRIDGFSTWDSSAVAAGSTTSSRPVSGIQILDDKVIAARGTHLEVSTGSGWTSLSSTKTDGGKYVFDKYEWDGTEKIVGANGLDRAFTYDGSSFTTLSSTQLPSSPSTVIEHKGRLFFGEESDGNIAYTAPYVENDGSPANGAGQIRVNDIFVGMRSFRENLIIFCKNSIWRLEGSSPGDYVLKPITRRIGCVAPHSIQEIAGELLFLGPDGLRTIAATDKIGDVALDNVSKPVQSLFKNVTTANINSVVVKNKTQYRIFLSKGQDEADTRGVIAALRRKPVDQGGQLGWEFSEIVGIKPNISHSDFIGDTETVLHGDIDGGFVYQQEDEDNSFDSAAIIAKYRTPDYVLGDAGLRKIVQRVMTNFEIEGICSFDIRVILNYDDQNTNQPTSKTITATSGGSAYGNADYGVDTYGVVGIPFSRQSLEGSGFAVALEYSQNSATNPSYTIRGFDLETIPGGRR